MKLSHIFTATTHEEHGTLGFSMNRKHFNEPAQAMQLAHDVLEHNKQDKGTFECEYKALGAVCHVRRALILNHSRAESIASDIVSMFTIHESNNRTIKSPTYKPFLKQDEYITDIIESVYTECVNMGEHEFYEDGEKADFIQWLDNNITAINNNIVYGYNRAQKRFNGIHFIDLYEIFKQLSDTFTRLLERAEEGYKIKVYIDFEYFSVDGYYIGYAAH